MEKPYAAAVIVLVGGGREVELQTASPKHKFVSLIEERSGRLLFLLTLPPPPPAVPSLQGAFCSKIETINLDNVPAN